MTLINLYLIRMQKRQFVKGYFSMYILVSLQMEKENYLI